MSIHNDADVSLVASSLTIEAKLAAQSIAAKNARAVCTPWSAPAALVFAAFALVGDRLVVSPRLAAVKTCGARLASMATAAVLGMHACATNPAQALTSIELRADRAVFLIRRAREDFFGDRSDLRRGRLSVAIERGEDELCSPNDVLIPYIIGMGALAEVCGPPPYGLFPENLTKREVECWNRAIVNQHKADARVMLRGFFVDARR